MYSTLNASNLAKALATPASLFLIILASFIILCQDSCIIKELTSKEDEILDKVVFECLGLIRILSFSKTPALSRL